MKFLLLLLTGVLIALSGNIIKAQIVLAPGDQKIFTTDPATGGSSGDNGNISFNRNSSHNTGTRTLKAEVLSNGLGVGTGSAFASIYYDFQVTGTGGTVGAWVNYEVFWLGFQQILATLGSNSYVNIELTVTSLTLGGKLMKRDIVHDLDLKSYSYKIITAGFDFNDTDTKINTLPIVLTRGHNYRVELKLTATLFITIPSIPPSMCDYMDGLAGLGNGRVELTNLYIKIGLDEKEILQQLAKIDSLEGRIDTLEYRLEHHYHNYLTGKGTGHNNTEANTTLSVFEEGNAPGIMPPVFINAPLRDLPDESSVNTLIPDDYSIGQNFPNPFNPETKIKFSLPESEKVTIKVFDILGREVAILLNEFKAPGYYEINFNADALPSGTYIYEIRAGDFADTKKMILLK